MGKHRAAKDKMKLSFFLTVHLALHAVARVCGQTAAQEPAVDEPRRAMLSHMQKGLPIPEIQLNTKPNEAAVRSVPLGAPLASVGNLNLHAFRFTTPEKIGHLVWAFEHTENIVGFRLLQYPDGQIPPAKSNLITAQYAPDAGKVFDARLGTFVSANPKYRILRVPGRVLRSSTPYVVWYTVPKGAEGERNIRQSANLFPYESYIPHSHLFPELGISSREE